MSDDFVPPTSSQILNSIIEEVERADFQHSPESKGGQQVGYFGMRIAKSACIQLLRELGWLRDTLRKEADRLALLTEAAEDWAKEQVEYYNDPFTPGFEGWNCESCERGHHSDASNTHTANCKAARILGLKREGE